MLANIYINYELCAMGLNILHTKPEIQCWVWKSSVNQTKYYGH